MKTIDPSPVETYSGAVYQLVLKTGLSDKRLTLALEKSPPIV